MLKKFFEPWIPYNAHDTGSTGRLTIEHDFEFSLNVNTNSAVTFFLRSRCPFYYYKAKLG